MEVHSGVSLLLAQKMVQTGPTRTIETVSFLIAPTSELNSIAFLTIIAVQFTLEQIDLVNRLSSAFPKDFSNVIGITADSALASFKDGKLISPLGVEGLHQIGNSVANLRLFHSLGARYITLTHNCGNIYADSALVENPFRKAEPYWGGLSPKGKKLVHEMNRIGMIVDLAHVSADTMRDVLGGSEWEGSKAPVMYSHSSAFSVCPHPRNVPDDILQLVKKTNSVVMGKSIPEHLSLWVRTLMRL